MLLSPEESLGVLACGVCECVHVVSVCVHAGHNANAAREPKCCSSHHIHSVSLELSKADPFFLAIPLIEPIMPTPEIQGQSFQQGKYLVPLSQIWHTLN